VGLASRQPVCSGEEISRVLLLGYDGLKAMQNSCDLRDLFFSEIFLHALRLVV
jgi:hypothetical protein